MHETKTKFGLFMNIETESEMILKTKVFSNKSFPFLLWFSPYFQDWLHCTKRKFELWAESKSRSSLRIQAKSESEMSLKISGQRRETGEIKRSRLFLTRGRLIQHSVGPATCWVHTRSWSAPPVCVIAMNEQNPGINLAHMHIHYSLLKLHCQNES